MRKRAHVFVIPSRCRRIDANENVASFRTFEPACENFARAILGVRRDGVFQIDDDTVSFSRKRLYEALWPVGWDK